MATAAKALPDTKLLVVEDDPHIAEAVTTYGRHLGYNVLHAATGPAAIELGMAEHPDVILLDIALPGMDGRDVFKHLKREGALEKSVVIFATARDSQVDRLMGLQMGADEYECKPFHLETLFHKINALLRKKRGVER